MGIAVGFAGKIYKGGVPTAMAAEASTQVGTTKTYQINNAAKRVFDPQTAVVVKVAGVAVALSNIALINNMSGTVTFIPTFTPASAPTFDGKYIPFGEIAQVKSWEGDPKLNTADATQAGSSNSGGFAQSQPTTFDWEGKLAVYGRLADQGFDVLFNGKTPLLVELDADGTGQSLSRAWVLITQPATPVKPKEIISTQMSFKLFDQSSYATANNGVISNAAFDIGTT